MTDTSIYQDIALRTDGAFMLGVVGPVRTGKSTFIKRFMETLVIPRIENTYARERARDELPQSGSGKTIMTAEPKFVPEEAVSISLDGGTALSVRLVDCVGYMVDGAAGQFEEGDERLVTTPWFDHEVTLTEAAEKGTYKVISEHSTIGIVVTCDGTVCDIPRESYVNAEQRVIRELKEIGKPFVVVLNSTEPRSERAVSIAREISEQYGVQCMSVNCLELNENDIGGIVRSVLEEFPVKALGFYLPEWLDALSDTHALKCEMFSQIYSSGKNVLKVKDCKQAICALEKYEHISGGEITGTDLGNGKVNISLKVPRALYYCVISESTGVEVANDADLISILSEMSAVKKEYDRVKTALENVKANGYGVVIPDSSQMNMLEPQIVRHGGKYTVKLKANAPAIHMIMTNVETEVTPAIGGETASEDIINFLLQGFDGDVNRIWQSNIFGKSLNDIAEEGLTSKIEALPEGAKKKLRETMERMINEGSSGLICILL